MFLVPAAGDDTGGQPGGQRLPLAGIEPATSGFIVDSASRSAIANRSYSMFIKIHHISVMKIQLLAHFFHNKDLLVQSISSSLSSLQTQHKYVSEVPVVKITSPVPFK